MLSRQIGSRLTRISRFDQGMNNGMSHVYICLRPKDSIDAFVNGSAAATQSDYGFTNDCRVAAKARLVQVQDSGLISVQTESPSCDLTDSRILTVQTSLYRLVALVSSHA